MGGSPSLRLLPRFMGPKTDSLSLSTKLINSLGAWPDKPLINWLHYTPSLSAAAGQSPSGSHHRPNTPFGILSNQGPSVGSQVFLLPRKAQSFWPGCPLPDPYWEVSLPLGKVG